MADSLVAYFSDASNWDRLPKETLKETIMIEEVGTVAKIGAGESKTVFTLTSPQEKILVLHLQRGALCLDTKGKTIETPYLPIHPNLQSAYTKKALDGTRTDYFFYNDVTTYLTIPLPTDNPDEHLALHLQEYGGPPAQGKIWEVANWPFQALAQRRIERFSRQHNLAIVAPEDFNKSEHYLSPYGRIGNPAVIDILMKTK